MGKSRRSKPRKVQDIMRTIRNELREYSVLHFSEDPRPVVTCPWLPITIQGILRIDAAVDKTYSFLTKNIITDLSAQLGISASELSLEVRFAWIRIYGPLPSDPNYQSVMFVRFADITSLSNTTSFKTLCAFDDYPGGVKRSHVGIRFGVTQSNYIRTIDQTSVDVLFAVDTGAITGKVDFTYQIHLMFRGYKSTYGVMNVYS